MGTCSSRSSSRRSKRRSHTQTTVTGSFLMPGVPLAVARETFCDLRAAPAFVTDLRSITFRRGKPARVGACWEEVRRCPGAVVPGNNVVVLRKTITQIQHEPYFSVSECMETVRAPIGWPSFICTFTIAITQEDECKGDETEEKEENKTSKTPLAPPPPPSSSRKPVTKIVWYDAFVTKGLYSKLLLACFMSCLKKQFETSVTKEMEEYYQEALRRTKKPDPSDETEREEDSSQTE